MKVFGPMNATCPPISLSERGIVRAWMLALVLFPLSHFAGGAEPPRIWVDRSGAFSVEAGLMGQDDERVILRHRDGHTSSILIEQLSEDDREYLEERQQRMLANANTLRLTQPTARAVRPLPVLDLPSADVRAEVGDTLTLAPPESSPEINSYPPFLPADPSPNTSSARLGKIQFGKVDVYDVCSEPIVLESAVATERSAKVAMSFSEGIGEPGNQIRSLFIVFDTDRQALTPTWRGDHAIRLLDYHAPSGRGLVLVAFDSLGKGGHFAVAMGLTGDAVRFRHQRPMSLQAGIGNAPHARWAKWIDDEHFVAVIDDTIGLWNIVSGKQVYRFDGIDTRAVPAISGGRRYLAIPREGVIELRRSVDGVMLGKIPTEPNRIAGVSFSPRGASLAIACPKRMRVWDLTTASAVTDIETRQTLGKRKPTWIDDDLILSSSGVLLSLSRGLPVWRYEFAGVSAVTSGDFVTLFRRDPITELVVTDIPHAPARDVISWIDQGGVADRDRWTVPGRSDWENGNWVDRDFRLGFKPAQRR